MYVICLSITLQLNGNTMLKIRHALSILVPDLERGRAAPTGQMTFFSANTCRRRTHILR